MSTEGTNPQSARGVTIRDVARAAGVSVGTVSRVLNGHPSVRAPMRQAVLEAVRALGYEPNEFARQLRGGRSRAIGIVVDDVIHSMNGYAVHGADDAARERGYSLLVAESRGDPARELELVRNMLSRRVEGLLSLPRRSRGAIAAAAQEAGVPVVFFGQVAPRPGTISAVIDEVDAIREAIQDLARHGHRHFTIIGDERRPFGARRIQTITELASEVSEDTRTTLTITSLEDLPAATERVLRTPDRPTAVIVMTHRCVPLVLLGIRNAGLELPRDVSIVAFGDSEWAAAHRPALNAIIAPYQDHVAAATHLLIDLIQGKGGEVEAPVHRSHYVRRESVATAPDLSS